MHKIWIQLTCISRQVRTQNLLFYLQMITSLSKNSQAIGWYLNSGLWSLLNMWGFPFFKTYLIKWIIPISHKQTCKKRTEKNVLILEIWKQNVILKCYCLILAPATFWTHVPCWKKSKTHHRLNYCCIYYLYSFHFHADSWYFYWNWYIQWVYSKC